VESDAACRLRAIEMDFATKVDREIPPADAAAAAKAGKLVWLDVEIVDEEVTRERLRQLGLCPPELVDRALTGAPGTQLSRYESCLHLVLTACRLDGAALALSRVDVAIGENVFMTLHRGEPDFLAAVHAAYRSDFQQHAKSPSFLLYELWDHLLESYHEVQKRFAERVEQVQNELVSGADDEVFQNVSEVGASLLHFRKVLLPARAVLGELSTRRSVYVSEATQPYLANMMGTVERVLQDLLVDREILAESMNLHMSIVGHRTNRIMNRLTVMSVIFLPLTFLCGVYGMNFEFLPEVGWKYGYLGFWIAVIIIVSGCIYYLRKLKAL
jgi:magnesium transporter